MKKFNRETMGKADILPEKVLMFGEGNFLRAFAGCIIQKLNDSGDFEGGITALQGTEYGTGGIINEQQGLYTVIERGMEKGSPIERFTVIDCIKSCVNPYTDYQTYLKIAENPQLSAIISNTTEFGICYAEGEGKDVPVHKNFPAKLTDFLYKRYTFFGGDAEKGLAILPCELIDRNGDRLKENVLRYAGEWGLDSGFISWLENFNVFANTLVDRIVSGYPKEQAKSLQESLGYEDNLLDVCEPFLLWVIEGDKKLLKKLPLDKYGPGIIVTDDMEPYRTRKVRILNGAHTMSVLAGHLCGFETVEQIVNDDLFGKYMQKGIFEEIIPAATGDSLTEYAGDVIERFKNPYLNHRLLSISLNSVSKFKTRVLPTVQDYISINGSAPHCLSFSFAALIAFYKQGINSFVKDEKQYIDTMERIFAVSESPNDIVKNVLSEVSFWGEDLTLLNNLTDAVSKHYAKIVESGIKSALEETVYGG